MIIYQKTVAELLTDIDNDGLVDEIKSGFSKHSVSYSDGEPRSWRNSFQFIDGLLIRSNIPQNAGVAIEYVVQPSSSRADLMISGKSKNGDEHIIIVELKQWDGNSIETIDSNQKEVKVQYENGKGTSKHPSYQAWSYANLLRDFNAEVQNRPINLHPIAYLHNYETNHSDKLEDELFNEYTDKAPMFYKGEAQELRKFIDEIIKIGDGGTILQNIAKSDLKPRKSLQNEISELINNNKEMTLVGEQTEVFNRVIRWAQQSNPENKKRVLIVEGEPGSGKTVVAVNLLIELLNQGLSAQYVSKNDQPRKVFEQKLRQGSTTDVEIDSLFSGSGTYRNTQENSIDVLVVDEAHRLNRKSGFYGNKGENQIKEIINSANYSIFFIDENQQIDTDDIGSVSEIQKHANNMDAVIETETLQSQLRCTGSGNYVDWIDDLLEIETNSSVRDAEIEYEIELYDDPESLHQTIEEKNKQNGNSRVVAGYCWDWDTDHQDDSDYVDIEIGDYGRSWNRSDGDPWSIDKGSIDEVGCIHTCQGLEFEYVGVIIGPDLRIEDGELVTDFRERSSQDTSWHGLGSAEDPEEAQKEGEKIIKNTYRTLLTRGMEGCYIYCCDDTLQKHIEERISQAKS